MRRPVHLIAAVAANGVIGSKGDLPWKSKKDLARFSLLTMGSTLVMGRKTFESIGHPLKGRMTIVVSRDRQGRLPGCEMRASMEDALSAAQERPGNKVWVAGGSDIYRQSVPLADEMSITHIDGDYEGDSYFPEIDQGQWRVTGRLRVEQEPMHDFVTYVRR